MIVNSMLIRRGLPVTLVMAAAILTQPQPASAGGYFSLSIGFHHPYHGHHLGHHPRVGWRHHGHYAWPYHFYPWGHAPVVVPVVAPSVAGRTGAVHLRVAPKKTDVYVDGRYAGRSSKFDGYPGYLWLDAGAHTLTFYRDGYRTVEQVIEVRAGMITNLRLQMAPGESQRPRNPEPRAPAADVRSRSGASPSVRSERPAGSTAEPRTGDPVADLRADGGRVRLFVEPPEASVYLDGRFLGTGAELRRLHGGLLLEAGEHLVEVVHPQYRGDRLSFRVTEGEELEVRIDLDPSAGESG